MPRGARGRENSVSESTTSSTYPSPTTRRSRCLRRLATRERAGILLPTSPPPERPARATPPPPPPHPPPAPPPPPPGRGGGARRPGQTAHHRRVGATRVGTRKPNAFNILVWYTPVIAATLSGLVPRDLVLRCHLYAYYYIYLLFGLLSSALQLGCAVPSAVRFVCERRSC